MRRGLRTHPTNRHSFGTQVAILVLAVATAFWCTALFLNLLAYLRWQSVLWGAMWRGTMFFATALASAAALRRFTRRRFWRRRASWPSVLPDLGSVTILAMLGAAWLLIIVPADTMLPTLTLPALIGTLISFEARDQDIHPLARADFSASPKWTIEAPTATRAALR